MSGWRRVELGFGFLGGPVAFLYGPEVASEELGLARAVLFDVEEERFEFVPRLVVDFAVTLLAEVFELLAVTVPAVTLFVVLARLGPQDRSAASDADDRLPVPVVPGTPHTANGRTLPT